MRMEVNLRREDGMTSATNRPPGTHAEELEDPAPDPTHEKRRLGDALVDAGLASRYEVEEAEMAAVAAHQLIGETLVERMAVDEKDVYRSLAWLHGLTFMDAESLMGQVDRALVKAVPPRFLEHNRILPVSRLDGKVVVVSCDVRPDLPGLAPALGATSLEYRLITPTDFRRVRMALELGIGDESPPAAATVAPAHDLLVASGRLEADSVELFDAILLEAIAKRASDIHLERYGGRVRFRLRIDGDLHDVTHFRIAPAAYLGLVNVVKVKADLDIAERRLPQGGRFHTNAGGRLYDLRVQTQPAFGGEHVVIRLLSKEMEMLYIEQLGLPEHLAATYRRLLASPSGLILVVGPTGCGKSTTLYAGLNILARDETRKVITVEDPIECSIENVQQTQVRPDLGFSFANAMRAFVREDPDVVLVGEIRDGETALEAIRASQTGHLVLSTLHTNDTVDAVQRLVDLGMHANSIASELLAVFAQRLAKRICTSCRVEATPDPSLVDDIFPLGAPAPLRCFHGAGCAHCGDYGTFGRIAVVEYLPVTAQLRRAISRKLVVDEMCDAAFEAGFVSAAHTEDDIDRTIEAAAESLAAIAR